MPKTKSVVEENTQEDIPQNITINGVEYTPEEAQSLVDLGSRTRDLEKQWDTPVDRVWPEYGKTREELKSAQTQLEEARQQLEKFQTKQDKGTETPSDIKAAQEAARKIGLLLNDDLDQRGYIKKEELDNYLFQHDELRDATKKVLDEGADLEKEINGKDGRPPFNRRAVIAYANAYNISDLRAAYEDMHSDQLNAWKDTQIASQRAKGLSTLRAGGAKSQKEIKVTDDNVRDLLSETLFGGGNE